jgi:hypothetical protein
MEVRYVFDFIPDASTWKYSQLYNSTKTLTMFKCQTNVALEYKLTHGRHSIASL